MGLNNYLRHCSDKPCVCVSVAGREFKSVGNRTNGASERPTDRHSPVGLALGVTRGRQEWSLPGIEGSPMHAMNAHRQVVLSDAQTP